jgi:hypothetical protein
VPHNCDHALPNINNKNQIFFLITTTLRSLNASQQTNFLAASLMKVASSPERILAAPIAHGVDI